MRIYDISREFFSASPYPGDPAPEARPLLCIDSGNECNTSAYSACTHTSTHIDAPLHYIPCGKDISELDPSVFVGMCSVFTINAPVTGEDIDRILPRSQKRILFRGAGRSFLTRSAAFALADAGILLVGIDAPSIGAPEDEYTPHKELLQAGIPVLENLNLYSISEGDYFLSALPIKMGRMDAAPVRAVLIEK